MSWWIDILEQIFEVCIIPLLGILAGFLIDWLKSKSKEIKATINNEKVLEYFNILEDTIITCVQATNQTYVEELKDKQAFDKEAQAAALQATYDSVIKILSDEAKNCLSMLVGDLESYIKNKIEQQVNILK